MLLAPHPCITKRLATHLELQWSRSPRQTAPLACAPARLPYLTSPLIQPFTCDRPPLSRGHHSLLPVAKGHRPCSPVRLMLCSRRRISRDVTLRASQSVRLREWRTSTSRIQWRTNSNSGMVGALSAWQPQAALPDLPPILSPRTAMPQDCES